MCLMTALAVEGSESGQKQVRDWQASLCVNEIQGSVKVQ